MALYGGCHGRRCSAMIMMMIMIDDDVVLR